MPAGMIATFTVDQQSSRELRQYLTNVAEQCACSSAADDITSGSDSWCSAPRVVVIDNLHHVTSLGDAFGRFLSDTRRPHRYQTACWHSYLHYVSKKRANFGKL